MSQENDSNTLCMWFAWGCRIHGFTNTANHVRVGWLRGHKGDLFLYSHDPKEHLNVQMQRTPKTKSAKQESKEHDMWRQFEVTVGHGLVTGSRANFQTKYVANCFIHVFWIVCESSWSSWVEWHQNKNHVVAGYTHSKHGTRLYMMNSKEAGAPCKKIMHAWHVKKAGSPCKKITIHWTKETMPSLTSTVRVHCVRLLSHRLTFFPPKLVALARQMLLKVNCAGLTFESHVNV